MTQQTRGGNDSIARKAAEEVFQRHGIFGIKGLPELSINDLEKSFLCAIQTATKPLEETLALIRQDRDYWLEKCEQGNTI